MKLRVIATLVAVMAFGAGSASAQSIGVFADLGSASCNITASPFVSVNFYINVTDNDAETALGNPMTGGCNIAFTTCQTGVSANLYSMQLVFLQSENTTANMIVTAHEGPSSPNFRCALVNLCDYPVFTIVCLSGGEAFVNGNDDCNVAVEEVTWSEVKRLFN